MTLAAIVMAQVGAVFGGRTERKAVIKTWLFDNKLILIGIAVELALLALLMYPPVPFTACLTPRRLAAESFCSLERFLLQCCLRTKR